MTLTIEGKNTDIIKLAPSKVDCVVAYSVWATKTTVNGQLAYSMHMPERK